MVWNVPWLPGDNDGLVTTKMTRELAHTRVINLMKTGSKRWDGEVLNDIFNEHDVHFFRGIPISTQSREDTWVWKFEKSGRFFVRSCYRALQGVQQWVQKVFWQKIWKLELPSKVINFAWRVCRGCLPTATALVMK